MYCKFCGEQIDDDCVVCPKCGKQVAELKTTSTSSHVGSIDTVINGKNKLVAGILAILLGCFGVHHFYLGNTGAGILSIVFFWTGIPALVGLIQGILILTESDEAFAKRIS